MGGVLLPLVAAAVTIMIWNPGVNEDERTVSAHSRRSNEPGSLAVSFPTGITPNLLRVTVRRDGQLAESVEGEIVSRIPSEALARTLLLPATYSVRFTYRGKQLKDVPAQVYNGGRTLVEPPLKQLAEVEYQTALAIASEGGEDDLLLFKRTLGFDPYHVNAHLQLAAYQVMNGLYRQAKEHLEAVRQVDPDNADAARIERLLRQRETGR
jgi:hypothetical protein